MESSVDGSFRVSSVGIQVCQVKLHFISVVGPQTGTDAITLLVSDPSKRARHAVARPRQTYSPIQRQRSTASAAANQVNAVIATSSVSQDFSLSIWGFTSPSACPGVKVIDSRFAGMSSM